MEMRSLQALGRRSANDFEKECHLSCGRIVLALLIPRPQIRMRLRCRLDDRFCLTPVLGGKMCTSGRPPFWPDEYLPGNHPSAQSAAPILQAATTGTTESD